jgi:hypothetical protein
LLTEAYLKEILSQKGIIIADQIRLILAYLNKPAKPAEIRHIALACGARKLGTGNPSAWLGKMSDARNTPNGWELTLEGKGRIGELISASPLNLNILATASKLRQLLSQVKNKDTQSFIQEAITCYENQQFRAAVVLSWVGAIAVLQDYVISNRLTDFNNQASQHSGYKNKWKPATNRDGLAFMQESDFLTVLQSIRILGKSTKQALDECLNRRNGCGHPNQFKIGEHSVTSHLEILLENVFLPFA